MFYYRLRIRPRDAAHVQVLYKTGLKRHSASALARFYPLSFSAYASPASVVRDQHEQFGFSSYFIFRRAISTARWSADREPECALKDTRKRFISIKIQIKNTVRRAHQGSFLLPALFPRSFLYCFDIKAVRGSRAESLLVLFVRK